jgi:hypothetical protein
MVPYPSGEVTLPTVMVLRNRSTEACRAKDLRVMFCVPVASRRQSMWRARDSLTGPGGAYPGVPILGIPLCRSVLARAMESPKLAARHDSRVERHSRTR